MSLFLRLHKLGNIFFPRANFFLQPIVTSKNWSGHYAESFDLLDIFAAPQSEFFSNSLSHPEIYKQ